MTSTSPPFNWQQTLLSQYANSPVITALLNYLDQCLDVSAEIDLFYNSLWNISTATGYGLDVWGRILGVTRVLTITSLYFGFQEANQPAGSVLYPEQPFGQAPLYGASASTGNYALSDAAFLPLLLAKAALNITNCSIPAINQILLSLFGASGACWCTDGGNMTMTYTFSFTPSPVQLAIILQSGALPRPCGVSVSIVHP